MKILLSGLLISSIIAIQGKDNLEDFSGQELQDEKLQELINATIEYANSKHNLGSKNAKYQLKEVISSKSEMDDSDASQKLNRDASQSESRRTSVAFPSRRQSRYSMASRKSIFQSHGGIWNMLKGFGKHVKYENTYRTEPKTSEKINKKQLYNLVNDTLNSTLKDVVYEPQRSQTMALNLANMLRRKIHEINSPSRYKFVVQVHMGSKPNNSVSLSSRALWNPEMGDTYISVIYTNSTLFAIAVVFAVYLD